MSAAAAEDAAPPSPSPASGFKLRRLEIENFKAIDRLELDLPGPLMEGDPDVFVIGSANGAGKTSVLEACALLWLAATHRPAFEFAADHPLFSLRKYFVRAGKDELRISGKVWVGPGPEDLDDIKISIPRKTSTPVTASTAQKGGVFSHKRVEDQILRRLFAAAPEPLSLPRILYFHCNRRIEHGPVQVEVGRPVGGGVKGELLSFLLAKAGLFENVKMASVTESATVLDKLFRDFADAKLSGLRSEPNNAFDVRVQPLADGDTFSLDALSSGQKEMITTLFLTWHHTRDNPGLVLIDEPELHLNAEWQIKFVRLLFKLAPQNQYIFATHSEFVFRSVQEDRRILIGPQG